MGAAADAVSATDAVAAADAVAADPDLLIPRGIVSVEIGGVVPDTAVVHGWLVDVDVDASEAKTIFVGEACSELGI